jgi:hypothetical protein
MANFYARSGKCQQILGVGIPETGPDRCMPLAQEAFPMSRVEPIDESRSAQEHRQSQPNPRKIAHTPDQAEGDERTVDEALLNQEQDRSS